jgi:amino acid permease
MTSRGSNNALRRVGSNLRDRKDAHLADDAAMQREQGMESDDGWRCQRRLKMCHDMMILYGGTIGWAVLND